MKPVPVAEVPAAEAAPPEDMLDLLKKIALGHIDASPTQVRAAIAAVQYTHAKIGEGGKKEQKQKAAEKVGARFAPATPPRLAAVGGKAV
jgi:phage terminase small subunit